MVSIKRSDMLVVRRDNVPLVGISGHQVASLPSQAEVHAQGERGPYIYVSWKGRTGFVLGDDLLDAEAVREAQVQKALEAEEVTVAPKGDSWLPDVILALATLAGAAGTGYAFLLA